jgi:hypothetical protein
MNRKILHNVASFLLVLDQATFVLLINSYDIAILGIFEKVLIFFLTIHWPLMRVRLVPIILRELFLDYWRWSRTFRNYFFRSLYLYFSLSHCFSLSMTTLAFDWLLYHLFPICLLVQHFIIVYRISYILNLIIFQLFDNIVHILSYLLINN